MGKANSELLIENENLFRTLCSTPIALLLGGLTASLLASSGIVLFKIIFVVLTFYFTLDAIAHAAYYTNERSEGTAEKLIKNTNLSKLLYHTPLAIFFVAVAIDSVASGAHIVFNIASVLIALCFTLSTLAYAAFYTNDRYEYDSHSA
jgi:hypothetical protein